MSKRKANTAFTLVEVVLAIGIVAFALLAIFSLFSSSLQSNKEVIDQVEVLSVNKAISSFLQSQPFATVYGWVQSPVLVTSPPLFYAYLVPAANDAGMAYGTGGPEGTGRAVVLLPTDPLLTTGGATAAKREGRLFGVYLTISPNLAVANAATPSSGDLPANPSPSPSPGGYREGTLGVQIAMYPLPQLYMAPKTGAMPVLTYDTTVQH